MKLPFYITLTILSLLVVQTAAAPIRAHDDINIPLDSGSNDLRPRTTAKKLSENILKTQKRQAFKVLQKKAKNAANEKLLKSKSKALSAAERADVKQAFSDAKQEMSTIQGLPQRNDRYTVGTGECTGREVRAAIFNTLLHCNYPIGRNIKNKQPKTFMNRPYPNNHPDDSLRGKTPLPATITDIKEYNVNRAPLGWLGSSNFGPMRVMTYTEGTDKKFDVVGHNPRLGGNPNDHYVAEKVVAEEVYTGF
ncbi:hypothetical protein H0H93_015843 [Arthromyces matolae]|nr:hypothetical protein H0H93_015843 [Arthromyces matolae]